MPRQLAVPPRGGRAPEVSSATPTTAPRIGSVKARGLGTMPHSLIGYAGIDGARGGDVSRDLSRQTADRTGGLFRP